MPPAPPAPQSAATACAECKRLKLRCDKLIPCSTCVKRRCTHLCPDGELVKGRGRGKRLVMADSRTLQNKIDEMTKRAEELQTAIAELRPPTIHAPRIPASTSDVDATLVPLMGTLSVGKAPRFIGQNAASSEIILGDDPDTSQAFFELLQNASSGPRYNFQTLADFLAGDSVLLLRQSFPDYNKSQRLVDGYFNGVPWLIGSLDERNIRDGVAAVYAASDDELLNFDFNFVAMLFGVFAIGAVFGVRHVEPLLTEGHRYCDLAALCLSKADVLRNTKVNSVRALNLMGWFSHLQNSPRSFASTYRIMGTSAQLARTLGLHRDDREWDLSEEEKQVRRCALWDTLAYAGWAAETCGRPPAFSLLHVDARLPTDECAFIDDQGNWQQSFLSWKRVFSGACLLRVLEQAFGRRPASHATIMRLDQMIRAHPISVHLQLSDVGGPSDAEQVARDVQLKALLSQRVMVSMHQHKLLFVIHRSFFARAAFENPHDPLDSPYRESVIGAFRSALHLSWCSHAVQEINPISERLPLVWAVVFTAAVFLCAIVIQSPRCGLAAAAWPEFEKLYVFMEKIVQDHPPNERFMPSVRRLRDKALAARAVNAGFAHTMPALDEMEIAFIYGGSFGSETTAQSTPGNMGSMVQTGPTALTEPMSSQDSTPFDQYVLESSATATREVPPVVTQWEVWLKGLEQSTGTHFPMLYGGIVAS